MRFAGLKMRNIDLKGQTMPVDQTTLSGRAVRLAVLIDADNVRASAAEAILNEIASYGDPSLRRVYGDWSSAS